MRKAGQACTRDSERATERARLRVRAREERQAPPRAMAMAMARHEWLAVGEVVELRSFESGFEGAWFKVIIMQLWALEARVNYWYFTKKGPGERAHTEIARLENLRPLPPQPERECVSWAVRDAVETRWMDAWWQGYIKSFDAATNKFRVYYGGGVPDLDIPGSLIRARLDWVPLSSDPSKSVWVPAENMQDPPVWVKVRMKKTPVTTTTPAMKTTAMKKRPVAQIRPRVSVPASHVGDESESENKLDGASWEAMEARRQKKIPRALSKSQSAPTQKFKKFKFVCGLTPKIARALPAIKPPPKPTSEQTIVSITPGSSPPLAESPVQDFEISSGSDSQAQKSLATPEVSPPTKASSFSSGSRGSGSSNSTTSGDDDNDCGESEDGDHPPGEDVPTSSFLHPFPDFSNETTRQCMAVYYQLLQCFLNDPKGYLDQTRERILKDIKDELSLPTDLCNEAHCAVFGLPPAFLNR